MLSAVPVSILTVDYIVILTPYDTIIAIHLSANGLYPSYQLSGLCIQLYLTALHVQTSTRQYIRLALQPVSIMNYLVLIPPSS